MRRSLLATLCLATAMSVSGDSIAQSAPASINDLLAQGQSVPLPPRRPVGLGVGVPTNVATSGAALSAPVPLAPQAPAAAPAPAQPALATLLPRASDPRAPARKAPAGRTSGADFDRFKNAVSAISNGDVGGADRLRNQISDPVARSAIEWLIARSAPGFGGASRAQAFLQQHPGWPSQETIKKNIEATLFKSAGDPNQVVSYFRQRPPVSGKGEIAYGRALMRTGRKNEGLGLIRKAWYTSALSAGEENAVLSEFNSVLTTNDHFARAQGMLYRERVKSAERMGKRLGSGENKLIRAWAAVIRRQSGAGSALNAVSGSAKRSLGYQFARIQHTRRADDPVSAARMMTKVPRDPNAQIDPGEWWTERRVLLRMLLDKGQSELAYRMAADHASTEPADIIAAEWHAGWVALSYRKDGRTAAKHFERMLKYGETPITVARAHYWHGRARAASGDKGGARRSYQNAAQHITTYYGQLAAEEIGQRSVNLGRIAKSNRSVDGLEPMRAAALFRAAGRNDLALSLTIGMSFYVDDGPSFARLAVLAREMGSPHLAVNIAKRGMRAGHNVADEAYPLSVIPGRAKNGINVPPALVYAIARQESEFNRGAVSGAGARGLMQLMPATAKSISRELGRGYSRTKLTADPDYNVALGSAYLGKRIRNFGGSYIMAAAAYNAGKGRVDQWIGRFGDPRSRNIDPIEWVERIPFSETRNYVMRVMENMQVYEARLSGNSAPLDLKRDLYNGR